MVQWRRGVVERLRGARSWRYAVLIVAFLPVLFTAGGCPDLTNVADASVAAFQWLCPLVR
jgi:hypothetical protein